MTQKPRRIQTAGKWSETEDGWLYAAVARSGEEVLARADFTLMSADDGSEERSDLPETTREEIERDIEEVVRQQAVRILDRRAGQGTTGTDGTED